MKIRPWIARGREKITGIKVSISEGELSALVKKSWALLARFFGRQSSLSSSSRSSSLPASGPTSCLLQNSDHYAETEDISPKIEALTAGKG